MYRAFFGLRERPFDLTPNPRFVVLTDGHREALSNLEYGIASRRGITLLIGEAGTGKTTLIRLALQRQQDVVHCVYLHNPALTREEFVQTLAERFDLSAAARSSKATLLNELEATLIERHRRGESTVLLIDEAQTLSLELLEEIRLLGNIETDDTKLLSIIMAGQPELAAKLNLTAIRQLKQRIALRCELRPLTQAQTAAYLAGRIRAAGGVGSQIFTREAVMLMHERARGIPRTLSVIADNALLTAFALGQKPINSRVVLEVCRDFELPASASTQEASVESNVGHPRGNQSAEGDLGTSTPAPASTPRVLAFDHPRHETRPPAVAGDTSKGVPGGIAAPRDRGGLFSSMYPKRRRFFLFRMGSR